MSQPASQNISKARSHFVQKLLFGQNTHAHSRPTTLPGPLKRSANAYTNTDGCFTNEDTIIKTGFRHYVINFSIVITTSEDQVYYKMSCDARWNRLCMAN